MRELLMGNEAVALGALAAGVELVSGYPGTPSSETLETVAARNPGGVHVEWSVNEKAALEVAAGAAIAGARSMVTMKQMGLNVASDPAICLNYIGVRGGMVIYVADDPGPISSQTEQDTRSFGRFAHIPVFDCDSPEQAFCAVQDAFEFSESHGTPVILRSTTRVCHACAGVDVPPIAPPAGRGGFVRDSRWVIFPRLSYQSKLRIAAREAEWAGEFSGYLAAAGSPGGNSIEGSGPIGIACGGISYAYVREAIAGREENFTLFKVATPYPFPAPLARKFMAGREGIIVFEELDPYIEDALICERGMMNTDADGFIRGKRSGDVPAGGELSAAIAAGIIKDIAGAVGIEDAVNTDIDRALRTEQAEKAGEESGAPALPLRPPVLCAGCPHRGAFYAVKRAVADEERARGSSCHAVYCGDIGCYTLGNAAPLEMVDTCLCMGAGITIAQGLAHTDRASLDFAFVGDSTFFASGITGTLNAVYNKADMILCVLDNSTTAMTGHQPHPGMGRTAMGEETAAADVAGVLKGIGVRSIRIADPLDLDASVRAVREAIGEKGVRAIIFKSPCIATVKARGLARIDSASCIGCMSCIDETGCPALVPRESGDGTKVGTDEGLCTGCGLCAQICPASCIEIGKREESL